MGVFNDRFRAYAKHMQLAPKTLEDIVGVKVKTINAYLTDKEYGRSPVWEDLVLMAERLFISLDWMAGKTVPMWAPEIEDLRRWLHPRARDISAYRPLHRCVQVVELVQERIPQAKEPWFVAGILGIGSTDDDLDAKREKLDSFMGGVVAGPEVFNSAVQRLAEFTGLSNMWLQLGRPEDWDSRQRINWGEWGGVFEEAVILGHTPDQFRTHMPIFSHILKTSTAAEPKE